MHCVILRQDSLLRCSPNCLHNLLALLQFIWHFPRGNRSLANLNHSSAPVIGGKLSVEVGMKVIRSLACIVSLALAVTQLNAQQPVTSGPLVREGVTEKISEHVYVIPDGSVGGVPNVGIIVGSKVTLVIDTGLGKQNGAVVLREAQKVSGKNALYLVTTHVHPEHDLGAHAFPPSTKMIRANSQVEEIATAGMTTANVFRGRSEAMKALLDGAEFRIADITFEKDYTLDLGGVTVQLLAMGPNHTPGDTAIVVPKEGVLFAGDIAMKALPAFASPKSSFSQWLQSLDRFDALKPRIVVPSHGPMDKTGGDAGFIANYRQYLLLIRTRVTALKAEGKSLDEATQTITAELKDKYSDSGRMGGAIRTAYAEAN
jgi:glyoxylase-like metal-dependent hydrolase (beta-lactamase superfamily II)